MPQDIVILRKDIEDALADPDLAKVDPLGPVAKVMGRIGSLVGGYGAQDYTGINVSVVHEVT
jgi:hypothetical protein